MNEEEKQEERKLGFYCCKTVSYRLIEPMVTKEMQAVASFRRECILPASLPPPTAREDCYSSREQSTPPSQFSCCAAGKPRLSMGSLGLANQGCPMDYCYLSPGRLREPSEYTEMCAQTHTLSPPLIPHSCTV